MVSARLRAVQSRFRNTMALPRFLTPCRRGRAVLVVGSRWHGDAPAKDTSAFR